MLITKFNKLIHNKMVWGIFAVFISVAFVFTFGEGSEGCSDGSMNSSDGVGTLYGEEISSREFFIARLFELGFRRNANLPAGEEVLLRQRVWQRLAALRTAERSGIHITDAEVAAAIQQDRTFAVDGQFDRARYRSIVQQQLGIDVLTFEEYLRQELTLDKMRQLAGAFTWSSPYEVDQSLADLTERRTVEYVVLPRETMTPPVTVSTNDVRTYYDNHRKLFEVPEKVSVLYVRFALTNYMDRVEVLDTNIVEQYNLNIDEYTASGTNGEDVVTSLDEVRDDIRAALEHDATLNLAMTEATDLVVSLVPGRFSDAVPFETAVANAGLAICTSALFSVDGDVPGLNVGQSFKKAAFDLDAKNSDQRFSDAVPEKDAVYVLAAHERVDAHIPDFGDVAGDVFPMALTNAQSEAFAERVNTIRERMVSVLDAGSPFSAAAALMSLSVVTTAQFSVYEGLPEGTPYGSVLPQAVMLLDTGELSEPVPVDVGYLIAHVGESQPGSPMSSAMLRPQLASSLKRYRSGSTYFAWMDSVLKNADFKDYSAEAIKAAAAEDIVEEEAAPVEE